MIVVIGAFNQEKALVGTFFVITNLGVGTGRPSFAALVMTWEHPALAAAARGTPGHPRPAQRHQPRRARGADPQKPGAEQKIIKYAELWTLFNQIPTKPSSS